MKRSVFFIGVVAFVSVFLINAFSAVAADKVIKMSIPCHVTPSYKDMFPGIERFVDRLNQFGGGKIQAKLYHSQTLYKVKEIVPALMNGSCKIIFHTSSHTTGTWPELGGINLPLLYKGDIDVRDHWMIGGELLNLVNEEMDRKYGVRILAPGIMLGSKLWTRGKPVEKVEDLKGMKIRSAGRTDALWVKAGGASPTFLSSAEVYEALKRGTIDGLMTYPGTIAARNLDEVVDYVTWMPLAEWGYQIYVLNKTFESWPKDVQDIVQMAAFEYDYRQLNNAMEYGKEKVFPRIFKKIKAVTPSPEAFNKFKEIGISTYPEWIKSVDKEFANKFIELSQKPLE